MAKKFTLCVENDDKIEFTRLPPQLGVAGHPRCVLAVSLVSKLVFLTLTKVEEQFVLVRHVSFIHEQVDGMHFDYDLGRFFISCRGKDMLQEVVIDGNGNYRRHGCALSDMLDPKSMKLKPSFDSGTPQSIFGWIKHEFLGQNYTYKQHVFATSRKRTHLYHLETKMKGSDGLTDTLVDQTLSVYNISDNNFEYLGVLNIKDIFTESHKQNDRSTQQSKVETQTSKIVGIYTSYSKEWDLSLMYDNGYQKRLNVLFSNGSSGGSVSCKLYHYLGRSIEPYPSKTLGAGSTQDSTLSLTKVSRIGIPTRWLAKVTNLSTP